MMGPLFPLVTLLVSESLALFNPTLSVDTCTQNKLVLTTTDAADGGIIYVQSQGEVCRQDTISGINTHVIDFVTCGIVWEETFKIVIQKKTLYQTGDDKLIPIMCVVDMADLTLTSVNDIDDKDNIDGQNATINPTASMSLHRDGSDISGQTVKLSDVITMILKLEDEYKFEFDIKATDCMASTIQIISESCSTDIDMFPHLSRVQQGELSATFGAFRTTNLNGGPVGMSFSCTLKVCVGSCTPNDCGAGDQSYGRKKRDDPDEGDIDDITVITSISVVTNDDVIEVTEERDEVCMAPALFVTAILTMIIGTVSASLASAIIHRKQLKKKAPTLKLMLGKM